MTPTRPPAPRPLSVDGDGPRLEGEVLGEGVPIVLLHGITATRRYLVHGSNALPRRGYELTSYDARGHGSSAPAPGGTGYSYPELTADLERVLDQRGLDRAVLCGHSLGAQTAASFALKRPERVAAAILAGPVSLGLPPSEAVVAGWDRLADGLERDGVEGFMAVYAETLSANPPWRETVLRFTRERLSLHRDPGALAQALREFSRSLPFDGPDALEELRVPALIVASHDEADPGHPYAVAETWSERLPNAELVSEEPGEAPLTWRGGQLSRAVADFLERRGIGGGGNPSG